MVYAERHGDSTFLPKQVSSLISKFLSRILALLYCPDCRILHRADDFACCTQTICSDASNRIGFGTSTPGNSPCSEGNCFSEPIDNNQTMEVRRNMVQGSAVKHGEPFQEGDLDRRLGVACKLT